ncbi:MAG TPA: hypothetical protein VLS96_07680 [Nodosilinea sp.]|nr:hypothetical protein [Nodosilinea sp.]
MALPVFANTASEQIGTQSATINGDNNQVIQVINQVNISHPGLGRGLGNNSRRGTVQDSYQGATIDGNGNSVYQESNQITQERSTGRPNQGHNNRFDDDDDDDDNRGRNRGQQRGRDRDDDDD